MTKIDFQPGEDWLQRLQQHDEQALAMLMKDRYTSLYSYASHFSKNDGLIKDCIQEVFISLWQRRESATAILSIQYYLLRAVKNKILKSLHRERRITADLYMQSDYAFDLEFSVEKFIIDKQVSDERVAALKRILAQLTTRQREAIYLKFYQQLDHGQIADLMNVTRQSVYNLLHEAIGKLRVLWHAEFASR